MNHGKAVNLVRWCTDPALAGLSYGRKVTFVSPVVSTVLAAAATHLEKVREVELLGDCRTYAEVTGLSEAIKGELPVGQPGSYHGRTYSRLTRLSNHNEVDGCNTVIGDLLHQQFTNKTFVNSVLKVVGELHDNVASHARGVGFSAAQVYSPRSGGQRLEFAIADRGCGMLYNVRRVNASVTTDEQAIRWCLKKGNTTAKTRDDWAQRLPEDCATSPFPGVIDTFFEENHHVGEGLFCLTELVRLAEGSLWIWSGTCQLTDDRGSNGFKAAPGPMWSGLAIEIEVDVDKAQLINSSRVKESKLEEIAARLGL